MTRHDRQVRVVHMVPGIFGRNFGGQTHYLYSLLSGWQDQDVTLDLWGTDVKPVNMNSGTLDYRLPEPARLWSSARYPGRLGLSWDAARLHATVVSRRGDFDIAHLHSLSWGEILSPLVLHRLGKKVVYTTSLFGSDNPGQIAARRGKLWLNLYRRFDGVVALSPALAEDCRNHGVSRAIALPNFLAIPGLESGRDLSLRAAVRARYQIPAEDPVLLSIGAAIRRKGLDIMIESYIRVAKARPLTWLVWVGPCSRGDAGGGFDASYVDSQRRRLLEAHVSDRVIWAGMVRDKHEMVGYYSAADVFVFPTRGEGLGNVLIEAAAAGLPAVATNLPGITDAVVVDGETGFLVPLEDVDAVTRAVNRLVSELSLRAQMGAAARVRSRLFNFENYCKRLKDFYLQVMESPPR
ncbi:MAG: glycosyltransferase family 4 protein [candidate division WOR-3 bacterium]|nr:MAG: glycosyltransferase family 4 protein [candidate division WOR-3 bacterium]